MLRFELDIKKPMSSLEVGFTVIDGFGHKIFTSHLSDDDKFEWKRTICGKVTVDTDFNLPTLAPGLYRIIFAVLDDKGITVIYSDSDLHLEIASSKSAKNTDSGTLWHSSIWSVSAERGDSE